MVAGRRVVGAEYAARVNAAADLVDAGMSTMDAARVLADRFAVSQRQARRYVDHASAYGRAPATAPVTEATTVFTVRLPASLAARVRARARESGGTISALVAQALTEFLARGKGKRPRQ